MQTERLKSLDAFRGFTIAAMIFVNYPGSWSYMFPPLRHAEWNGLTPTDLIFPFFLFIVGVSIALAYSKQLNKGIEPKKLIIKIVSRTIKIFLVGVLLNLLYSLSFSELRIAGVLQRISIVFLVCSLLFLTSNWKTQAYIATGILIFYWIIMCFVPIPGIGKVSLEPGVNIAAYIDSFLLPGKMWNVTWDPEGLFSTLPALATGILGMLVGKLILSDKTRNKKLVLLFFLGTILSILGYLVSLHFPVNKNIWSSSFVLVTAGFASLALASLIFVVDELNRTKIAQIGIIFGSNAITIYVLAQLISYFFYGMPIGQKSLNQHFVSLFIGSAPKLASLFYSAFYLSLIFIPAYILHKKKIFIKL